MHSDPDDLVNSSQRWQQINNWLIKHQIFWRSVPFVEPVPEWCLTHRELARKVTSLSNEQCDHLADHPANIATLASNSLPSLGQYLQLIDVPVLAPRDTAIREATLPETEAKGMPGRKRIQSGAFAASIGPLNQPILDWCCGKGHLSRTLAVGGSKPVLGYEWDDKLVREGNRLADHYRNPVVVQCQDVMAGDLRLPEGVHGVALHACGDLHRRFIQRGCEASLPRLSLSPCCYHLGDNTDNEDIYRPLSAYARNSTSSLILLRGDIRLAVQETVTAPAGVREQRRIIRQWRLGFDCLQRNLRGVDAYLPVPSYAPSKIHKGFRAFCYWAAEKKGVTLPVNTNFDRWMTAGAVRLENVRRHELIRHLFRRPLELWLALDYVIFLQEKGYHVRFGQFCERSLTPRNLMIDAIKTSVL
jgi:hypothetical protein